MGGLGVLKPKDIPDSPPAMGAMPAGSSSTRTKSSVSGALGGGADTRQTIKAEDYKPDFSGITQLPSLDTEKLTPEQRDALAAETERRLGRAGIKEDRDRQMKGLKALKDEFGMTPEEREKAIGTERVMAGLGQGSMTGFAQAGRAGAKKERDRQRRILEGYLESDRAITSDFRTRDVDIGKSAIKSVEDAVASLAQNQRVLYTAAASMRNEDMRTAVAAADRALKIDQANIENDFARTALEIEQANSIKTAGAEKKNKLEETYRKGAEVLFKAIKEAQDNDTEVAQLMRKAAQATNPKMREELELQARLKKEAILISVNKAAAISGLLGQIETAGNALGYEQPFKPGIDRLADPGQFNDVLNKYGT
jgi:tetratricopeptide (TPR) repeat protein